MSLRSRLGRSALIAALLGASIVLLGPAEHASATACAPSSAALWDSCSQTTITGGTAVREEVTYTSDGITVHGIVCRPIAAGNYPILVQNHGGFQSTTPFEESTCANWSTNSGYIVVASSYRVINTGAPLDDTCKGEVDDVLNMLAIAATHPDANENRVVMRGASHGGCVTLRAYQRGVPGLKAAVAMSPPTDGAALWSYVHGQYISAANLCGLNPPVDLSFCDDWLEIQQRLEDSTGGPPSPSTQAEYDVRSAISDLHGLDKPSVPLLIVHGRNDQIVPPSQPCSLVKAVNDLPAPAVTFGTYHINQSGGLTFFSVPGCTGITWPLTGNPVTSGWPGTHYLLVYEGVGHVPTPNLEWYDMLTDTNSFLLAKNP